MRYMLLLSGTNPSTPPPPTFEAMKLGGEASQAGVLLGTRVAAQRQRRTGLAGRAR